MIRIIEHTFPFSSITLESLDVYWATVSFLSAYSVSNLVVSSNHGFFLIYTHKSTKFPIDSSYSFFFDSIWPKIVESIFSSIIPMICLSKSLIKRLDWEKWIFLGFSYTIIHKNSWQHFSKIWMNFWLSFSVFEFLKNN